MTVETKRERNKHILPVDKMAGENEHLNEMDVEESDTESSSDEDDDSPNPDAYTGNEQVQVDFMGRSPTDPDCHGIAQLLSRVFLKAHVNCREMADLIISQNYVGSVICQCEDDEPESEAEDDLCEDNTIFAITTVINISAKKQVPCIAQLHAYILSRAEKHATDAVLTHFREVLSNDSRTVGFLINERFINIPVMIAVPSFESLLVEINTAANKGMPFKFDYYLMIVKFYRSKAKKGKPSVDTFTNEEEEIFCKKALNGFEYSVVDECDMGMGGDWCEGDPILTPYRKAILFDASVLQQAIVDIKKMINN